MSPQVSIITPSFRQLAWLKLCAASVADQSGVTFEHIVQDAGTGAALEAWAQSQPGVRLIVEKDAGMYDAINRGLRQAQGEICAYLNCDEQYLPGTLEKVVRYFTDHPEVDVLFGDAILTDGQGQPLSFRRVILPSSLHTRLVHLNTLSCATFFRRSVVERGLYFEPSYRAIGDAVWIYRLLKEGVPMGTLHEALAVFAFTGANLGADERSQAEAAEWRQGEKSLFRFLTLAVILHHRLKKLLAGAYTFRSGEIELYTFKQAGRKTFPFRGLSYNWPKADSVTSSEQTSGTILTTPPKVAAVFTTFNRQETALICLNKLQAQTTRLYKIVIVDNGSTNDRNPALHQACAQDERVELLTLSENLGNPGGLRLAIQAARKSGANRVWILDDDSWPLPDALEKLLSAGADADAVYSSLVIDPETKDVAWPYLAVLRRGKKVIRRLEEMPKDTVVEISGAWLGALYSQEILDKAGELNADLFIRGEDEEYPARIRSHGYRFYCVKDSVLHHPSPQRLLQLSLFGKSFFYEPRLPLWKSYYVLRNQTYVRKKYAGSRVEGLWRGLGSILLSMLMVVFVDDHKRKRLALCLKAGWHGLTNQLGKKVEPTFG